MNRRLVVPLLVLLAACLIGMALAFVGYLWGTPKLVDVGELLTLPFTIVLGVAVALAVIGTIISAPLELLARARSRRRD